MCMALAFFSSSAGFFHSRKGYAHTELSSLDKFSLHAALFDDSLALDKERLEQPITQGDCISCHSILSKGGKKDKLYNLWPIVSKHWWPFLAISQQDSCQEGIEEEEGRAGDLWVGKRWGGQFSKREHDDVAILLLAPQSAHTITPHRDFHPNPYPSTY